MTDLSSAKEQYDEDLIFFEIIAKIAATIDSKPKNVTPTSLARTRL